MPKSESWQRDPESYPFSTVTETRFQDLDPLGHINNVAMAALFENGRVRFNRNLGLERRQPGERWLIASVSIDYVAEAHFPDPVEVMSGIGRIGSSSWDIYSAAFQQGVCVATCVSTLVLTDKAGPKSIPDPLRQRYGELLVRRS
ncbi:acyl-CoA thioesterase [Sphingomonas sp. 35-24ZXX]|uniref:acyl-CoA thioesterase n=1 Tax=Sphingomonas sp. 35-24ZXX TaxID=1545915 RepID=UPI00053C07DB|nr:acyl-CoA thioesterase [Sphingomonas sp. 35-24ZXX]